MFRPLSVVWTPWKVSSTGLALMGAGALSMGIFPSPIVIGVGMCLFRGGLAIVTSPVSITLSDLVELGLVPHAN